MLKNKSLMEKKPSNTKQYGATQGSGFPFLGISFLPSRKGNTAASFPQHSHLSAVQPDTEHQPPQAEKVVFMPSAKLKSLHTPAKQDVLSPK